MKKTKAILPLAAMLALTIATGCGSDKAQAPGTGSGTSSVPACCTDSGSSSAGQMDLSKAKDGMYTAESEKNPKIGYGKLELTIQDHKITKATYTGIDKNGAVKTEDYGKQDGEIKDQLHYRKAQTAYKAHKTYADELVKVQQVEKVDAIAGATISHDQFVDAVNKALAQATR